MKPGLLHKVLRLIGHQHWIRIGLRDRLLKHFVPLSINSEVEFECEFGPYIYKGDLGNLIDWRVFMFGAHELSEIKLMSRFGSQDTTFLDVGTNVGHHAVYLSSYFGKVIGFEPYAPLYEKAVNKVLDNKIDNVSIYNIGLGNKHESLAYVQPPAENLGLGKFIQHNQENESAHMLQIEVGDSFLSGNCIDKVSLIKIDVEGMEWAVIQGLRSSLAKERPVVFFEFGSETRKHYSNLNMLTSDFPPGYRFFRVVCNTPFILLFNKSGCCFDDIKQLDFEGNIIAMPQEFNIDSIR